MVGGYNTPVRKAFPNTNTRIGGVNYNEEAGIIYSAD